MSDESRAVTWRPKPPATLAERYELTREVEALSYGAVFEGRDTHSGDAVSVTVIHPSFFVGRPGAHNKTTIEKARAFSHGLLLPIRDVSLETMPAFVVSGPSIGQPLPQWRREAGRIGVDTVYRVLGQLIGIVESIHRDDGLHGALSPETVRVLDGHARIMNPFALESGDDLNPGELPPLRTAWLAPERLFDVAPLSAEADVYGLGLTLGFLMACGLTEPGHSLMIQGIDIAPPVDEVYVRATARQPEQRYSSVAALREALEKAAGFDWRDAQTHNAAAGWQIHSGGTDSNAGAQLASVVEAVIVVPPSPPGGPPGNHLSVADAFDTLVSEPLPGSDPTEESVAIPYEVTASMAADNAGAVQVAAGEVIASELLVAGDVLVPAIEILDQPASPVVAPPPMPPTSALIAVEAGDILGAEAATTEASALLDVPASVPGPPIGPPPPPLPAEASQVLQTDPGGWAIDAATLSASTLSAADQRIDHAVPTFDAVDASAEALATTDIAAGAAASVAMSPDIALANDAIIQTTEPVVPPEEEKRGIKGLVLAAILLVGAGAGAALLLFAGDEPGIHRGETLVAIADTVIGETGAVAGDDADTAVSADTPALAMIVDTAGEATAETKIAAAADTLDPLLAMDTQVAVVVAAADTTPSVFAADTTPAPDTTPEPDTTPLPDTTPAVAAADTTHQSDTTPIVAAVADTNANPTTAPDVTKAPTEFVPTDWRNFKCPGGMARLRRRVKVTLDDGRVVTDNKPYCIDRHEFPGAGSKPQVNVGLAGAKAACKGRGKRLCSKKEWRGGCGGKYPYGKTYEAKRCNTVGSDFMPRPLVAAGSKKGCKGSAGTYDMVGNVAEWTSNGYVNGGSAYKHGQDGTCYKASRRSGGHPYVGFRCCAAARPK